MPRTAPAPNMIAIPGMNPGMIVAGGGGGAGGGSGGSGKGKKKGKGKNGEDGGDDAEGGGKDGKGGEGCGDPVCPITGKMFLEVMDFAFWATKELKFIRHYSSRRSDAAGSFGFGWTHPFGWQLEERRRAIFVYDDRGDRQKFARPVDGGPASPHPFGWTLARVGNTYRLTRDGGETLTFERHAAAKKFLLRYLSDVRGNTTTVEYDERGRFIGLTDSERRPFRATLDELGRIVRFQVPTEPTHQTWMDLGHYRYDEFGDLVEYIDAVGFSWQYRYHNHLMVEHRTGCGLSYLYRYDGDQKDAYCIETWGEYVGRDDPALLVPISEVLKNPDPLAPKPKGINYVKFTYFKDQFSSEVENGLGGVTRYFGDSYGRVIKKVEANGRTTERTFDPKSGKVASDVGPDGLQLLPILDDFGNPRGFVRPDGSGIVTATPEPFLKETTFYPEQDKFVAHYDLFGSPIHYKHPDGTFETFEYDERGLPRAYVDRSGGAWRYVFDGMGNLVEVHSPSGLVGQREFDYLGRCTLHRHFSGEETRFAWDGRSEVVHRRTDDGVDEYAQHEANRKVTRIQKGNRVWTREYGGLGWLIRETDPTGAMTEYRYDVEGNIVWVRNARGQEYRVRRDSRGEIVHVRDFEGREETRQLDLNDEVSTLTTPSGPSSREYDPDGRLLLVETPDDTFSLEYDSRGVRKIASSSFALEHEYDVLGRTIFDRQGPHETRVSWRNGWIGSVQTDVGVPLEFVIEHNSVTRLRAGSKVISAVYPKPSQTLHYLGDGLARQDSLDRMGALLRATYGRYRSETRLSGGALVEGGLQEVLLTVDYTYNEHQEIVQERQSTGRVVDYDLDAAGRIVGKRVSRGGQVLRDDAIRYDAVGTPLLAGVAFDVEGRAVQYRGETFEYDAEGRLSRRTTDRGIWTYEWDYVGNLRVVRSPSARVEMTYDGRGRRMSKLVTAFDGTVTGSSRYVWSNQTLMHEVDELTGWTRTYLRKPERWAPFGHVDSKGGEERAFFYHCDPSGMPDIVFDEGGNVAWSAERTVFGDLSIDASSSIRLDVRFAGQLYDPDVELTYNRRRWYDARTGQYVSPDPISLDGGVALRNYVRNPTVVIDPMGETPDFSRPDSLKDKISEEAFAKAVPGKHANLDPNAAVPGFINCPPDELNAGGHTPEDAASDKYEKKFSKDTTKAIDKAGAKYGCHTCGSKHPMGKEAEKNATPEELAAAQKSTHFVPDHVPPANMHTPRGKSAQAQAAKMDPSTFPPGGVKLFPHCRSCASSQGGTMSGLTKTMDPKDLNAVGKQIMKENAKIK